MATDEESETKAFMLDCRALGLPPPPVEVSINWPKSWAGRRVSFRVPHGSLEALLAWAAPLQMTQISLLVHATGLTVLCGVRSAPRAWDHLSADLEGVFARLRPDGQVVLWLHGDAEVVRAVGERFHGTTPRAEDRSLDPFAGQDEDPARGDARSAFGLPARQGALPEATRPWNDEAPGEAPGQDGPCLTRRQDHVLRESIRMGYYELPRRVHLRDIAKELGTSVASLAEVLRRAETRLAECYASTPPTSGLGDEAARDARAAGSGSWRDRGGTPPVPRDETGRLAGERTTRKGLGRQP